MPHLPDDPYFQNQWYLLNLGQTGGTPGIDLNVTRVWADYAGRGVSIGIYDDGLQYDHPDLDDNYDASLHVGDGDFTQDPYGGSLSGHGTSVAGVIAAEANGVGTVGVAWGAQVTGVQVYVFAPSYVTDAYGHFDVTNHSYYLDREPNVMAALQSSVETGRCGLGSIHIFAVGNTREWDADVSGSLAQSTPYAISVGSVDHHGFVTDFSSAASQLLVVTPSNGSLIEGVWTTDRTGRAGYSDGRFELPHNGDRDYTADFGGTSASAPMVSGVVALMLEANPDLGWRDVQTILAASARHSGSAVGAAPEGFELHRWGWNHATGWNGGGLHYSNDYGFGLLDALAAVRLAETWTQQSTSATLVDQRVGAVQAGPFTLPPAAACNADGLVMTFRTAHAVEIERMTLRLDFDGYTRIRVWLTSPDGTEVVILSDAAATFGSNTFAYTLNLAPNAFRGEMSAGLWTLRIETLGDMQTTLTRAALRALGAAASDDDVLIYTNAFSDYAGTSHSTVVGDGLGRDTVNAAAVGGDTELNLSDGTGRIDGVAVTLAPGVADLVSGDGRDVLRGDGQGQLLLSGRGGDRVQGRGGNDRVLAGSDADTAAGGAGQDRLLGQAGADRLHGGAGPDLLFGGAGRDTVSGGAGDDRLHDGAGIDYLTGGAGADIFVLSADGALDLIADFTAGIDLIDLRLAQVAEFSDLVLVDLTGGVWELRYAGESLRLLNGAGATLTAADVVLL